MFSLRSFYFMAFLSFATSSVSLAQSANSNSTTAEEASSGTSDKIDLKKLEDKYWSAKDQDFAVVQNRTYVKEKRFFANLGYGILVNDAYSNGRTLNFVGGYYFSERWGVELAIEKATLSDNASVSAFINQNRFRPNYNRFNQYQSVNALFVPFYAKMSMLDRAIVYFDIQFALGLGTMNYDSVIDPSQGGDRSTSAFAYNFDFTQQLYFSKHWAFRLDLKNKWSRQNVFRYQLSTGEPEGNRGLAPISQQDTSLVFGLTYLF